MKDITPARISKWCKITSTPEHTSMSILLEPDSNDLLKIKEAMRLCFEEMKPLKLELEVDESFFQAYIFEWAFYIKALNRMDDLKSEAEQRHITPLSYLANFGISNKSRTNVTLGAAKFSSGNLDIKKLTIEAEPVTGNSSFLYGNRDTYMDKHELLFCEFESRLGQIVRYGRNHIIKRQYSSDPILPIEQAIRNQQNMNIVMTSPYVRIIVSIFIILLEYRFFLREPHNHKILSEQLDNISIMVIAITEMVRKKWYWVHADSSGELSLINRGIIRIPEEEDALFFSLSRVWGIFFPSRKSSDEMFYKEGKEFKINEVRSISGLGETIGYKVNKILFDNPPERELFYPEAKKLAFHPTLSL